MRSPIGSYQAEIAKINQSKYACPPSWILVQEYLDQFNMKLTHLERFFGIPFNTLSQVKAGTRPFPQYAWHLIYEKKRPRYGSGFVIETKKIKDQKERIKRAKKSKLKTKEATIDSHNRLSDIT